MSHPWPHDDVQYDFRAALRGGDTGEGSTRTVGVPGETHPTLAEDQVAEVVRWHVSYHSGAPWKPGDEVGTELKLAAVLRLHDGRWISIVAGNDYTGWGCQDWSDVRIGATEAEVAAQGLDQESRVILGYGEAS